MKGRESAPQPPYKWLIGSRLRKSSGSSGKKPTWLVSVRRTRRLQTYELIQGFTTMLRERQGDRLDSWLKVVKEQGVAELQSFAQGLERDYEAVKAGLTLPWSQGPVEGHVHRLKLIKRQAYGRASFQTLRKRVLRCG